MKFLVQHNNYTYLKKYRKKLRKNLTPAEAILWRFLKSKQMEGIKFRRQFSVGNYIVDFYCPKYRLAIELDGAHHFTEEGIEDDKKRDDYLSRMEVTVLRFENALVLNRTETVLSIILDKIKELEKEPFRLVPRHLPLEREGEEKPLRPAVTSPGTGEEKKDRASKKMY